MQKLSLTEFSVKKRKPLLDYRVYEFNFDDRTDGFNVVRKSLLKSESQFLKVDPYRRMVPVKQRAWDGIVHLANCYSGGHLLTDISSIYPAVLEYWATYLERFEVFVSWEGNYNKDLAALPLQGDEFAMANQFICMGILFGYGRFMAKAAHVVDMNNARNDGLIERLLAPYVPNRCVTQNECTRHLPYIKTLKIFSANPADRPEMMRQYLDDWYRASRQEGYYNSHKKGDTFTGYWSWEAAAITYLLDIDDSLYRKAKFYPGDLVDFARDIHAPRWTEANIASQELRAKSGLESPRSGIWQTLDIPLQTREFTTGEILHAADPSYDMTAWQFIKP